MTAAETSSTADGSALATWIRERLLPSARTALLVLFVLIVFQQVVGRHAPAVWRGYRWLDELALALVVPVALLARVTRVVVAHRVERWLLAVAMVFGITCAASAWSNQLGASYFVLGTLDYLRALALCWSISVIVDRTMLRRFVVLVVLLASTCASWMIVELVVGSLVWADDAPPMLLRFGLWRPRGLFGHPNLGGLFMLIAIAVEMTAGKRRPAVVALFFVAAIFSMSRIVHAALFVMAIPLATRARYALVGAAVALALSVVGAGVTQSEMTTFERVHTSAQKSPKARVAVTTTVEEFGSYRAFALSEGLAIWRDNRFLGIGPGRFGGTLSLALDSPIYRQRGWPDRWMSLLKSFRSLDMFYPRLLAELGMAGALAFAGMGLVLFVACERRFWRARHEDGPAREWAAAGALVLVIVPLYLAGSGLNQAPFIVPLMIVVGAGITGPQSASE